METSTKINLVKCTARDYDFVNSNGKQVKGTSYKAILLTPSGDLFELKADTSVYDDTMELVNQEGTAVIEIKRNEVTKEIELRLKEFNWK